MTRSAAAGPALLLLAAAVQPACAPAVRTSAAAPVPEIVAFGGDLFAAMGAGLWKIPGGGVARSRDGGDTWEAMEGLPARAAVKDLVVHGGALVYTPSPEGHPDFRRPLRYERLP